MILLSNQLDNYSLVLLKKNKLLFYQYKKLQNIFLIQIVR